jgi:hypothetical protein
MPTVRLVDNCRIIVTFVFVVVAAAAAASPSPPLLLLLLLLLVLPVSIVVPSISSWLATSPATQEEQKLWPQDRYTRWSIGGVGNDRDDGDDDDDDFRVEDEEGEEEEGDLRVKDEEPPKEKGFRGVETSARLLEGCLRFRTSSDDDLLFSSSPSSPSPSLLFSPLLSSAHARVDSRFLLFHDEPS